MKHYFLMAAGLLAFAAIPTFAAPIVSFPECPAIGNDTSGCEFLITVTAVNASGAATAETVAVSSPDLGPFDASDDTLVGILNSSTATLKSIALSSSLDIFGFDGDGACSGDYPPFPACTGSEPNGYGGFVSATTAATTTATASNVVTYSGINAAETSGTVNFGTGGVAVGGSAWFSLEEALTISTIGTGPTTPEPDSLVLIGTGLSALYFVRRRRKA